MTQKNPKLRDTLLSVIQKEYPGRILTKDAWRLTKKHWSPSAISACLVKLVKENKIEQIGKGVYRAFPVYTVKHRRSAYRLGFEQATTILRLKKTSFDKLHCMSDLTQFSISHILRKFVDRGLKKFEKQYPGCWERKGEINESKSS